MNQPRHKSQSVESPIESSKDSQVEFQHSLTKIKFYAVEIAGTMSFIAVLVYVIFHELRILFQ
jgi:hypothetical protein